LRLIDDYRVPNYLLPVENGHSGHAAAARLAVVRDSVFSVELTAVLTSRAKLAPNQCPERLDHPKIRIRGWRLRARKLSHTPHNFEALLVWKRALEAEGSFYDFSSR
jgi:hypothetical protein